MNTSKTFYLSLFLSLFLPSSGYAQSSDTKLTGTIIGTKECVDYSDSNNFTLSYTVNTANNLFDGDYETIFATYQRSGGWAGLDLGEKHIITHVAYCPRRTQEKRLRLGLFQGANQPDFSDAIPIYISPDVPKAGEMTVRQVNCSRGFRYVRYVGPNDARCNIAELAFFGTKGEGDDSQLYQLTNLPTVSINTEDNKDIVIKEQYLAGNITVISGGGKEIYSDNLQIRGRGNASWNFPKKPYRFKLEKAVNLLGMPARKKRWTLINNYGDKTLMRNLLAFDLSQRLELSYTPAGRPVDVILNGEYKGTYQLCDQIEVNDNRVEVDEMLPTDTELPRLSGGYLLEIDAYAADAGWNEYDKSWFHSSRSGTPVTIKYPKDDKIVTAQTDYIKKHFNKLEAAVYAADFTDPMNGYRKYFDISSFVRHFLVGEISGNTDTYWSVYMYKQRNDDVFYFGPVWDFDIAYENDNRTFHINNKNNWIYATNGSYASGMRGFVNRLFQDAAFAAEVKDTYALYRSRGVLTQESLTRVIDDYEDELQESQQLNFLRWPIMQQWVHQNPAIWGSYRAEVENVRSYVKARLDWIDTKLGYDPTGMTTTLASRLRIWAGEGGLHISNVYSLVTIHIYNMLGQEVYADRVSDDTFVRLEQGVYVVKVIGESGEEEGVKCVVK